MSEQSQEPAKPEQGVEEVRAEAPEQPEVQPDVVVDPEDTHAEGVDREAQPEQGSGEK